VTGLHQQPVEALSFHAPSRELGETIGVHLLVNDLDDLRGALLRDSKGRSPRGDLESVRRLLRDEAEI